jgi:hypothetical protein
MATNSRPGQASHYTERKPMTDAVPLVNWVSMLTLYPCPFHTERAAGWLVMTKWGTTALLCDECRAKYADETDMIHASQRIVEAPHDDAPLTIGAVRDYIDGERWVYAKTMPKWPHEYVLLRASSDPWMHLRVLGYMRQHAEWRPWGRHRDPGLPYWRDRGRDYWSMPPNWLIINRTVIPDDD